MTAITGIIIHDMFSTEKIDSKLAEAGSSGWQYVGIGSGDDLVPNGRQAAIHHIN